MSPSFYRTIHKQEESRTMRISHNAVRLFKQHAAKIVVCSIVFVLLFTSFLLMGTEASGKHPAAATAQEHTVTVNTGDTLWRIAKQYSDGNNDIRYIIYLIKDRNSLQTADIIPGQKLVIPSL